MTVQRIDPRRLPSEVRRINRGLMAEFVGADPYGRRNLSPRKSIVFTTGGLLSVRVERKTQPPYVSQAVPADAGPLLVQGNLIAPHHTSGPRLRLGASCCVRVCHWRTTVTAAAAQPWPLGGSRRRGRLAIPRWTTPRRFDKNSPRPKCHPAPPISLCCCATRGLARVDGQNAQKAKIARYAGCEHNRDAVRADP